ncbi:PREDICTED: transcription factor CP2-like protein 1 isoform X2 [Nicrophorus vespilloides]|uniref:Transcription factor CP2-like protein 1 isoform X2 n=1 Tax=Nicrophorus vespilloides TaxID=110193 RepID=A0ABM1NID8_NICVS|nr:PREDICTED: transcription factor CP2-like protein 1 isoform X2 [Nicrophorus vespilloides]
MDFQMYENAESPQILLLNESRCKNWNINMENEEYFQWMNNSDEGKFEKNPPARKRKIETTSDTDDSCGKQETKCDKRIKKNSSPHGNGNSRMPQWQVDDIAQELNADIEGSINALQADQSNNSFNMSEAILSLSNMTVFKQEAPSPTDNPETTVTQFSRQNQPCSLGNQQAQVPVSQANNINDNQNNTILNTTLQQLLSQTGYNSIQNIDSNLLNSPTNNLLNSPGNLSQDGYGISPSFTEDCRFQYVLAAATSIATKMNEDTLTYLNQGQSYEIKLKKLGDLSTYRGKLLKSVIRICFHERRLQYMEKEQMTSWQQSRPGDRILEVDVPLSYGLYDVSQPAGALNTVQFSWDPTKEVGAYIKVNCISTEFTPKKHGGEKGVPFRIQVETYQGGDGYDSPKRLHAAACQIKVFKLKGADRKHKQDREKIIKRSISEQEKYQPSYDCTVLNDIPNESLANVPIGGPFSPESTSQNNFQSPMGANEDRNNLSSSPSHSNPINDRPTNGHIQDVNHQDTRQHQDFFVPENLGEETTAAQTNAWLNQNRFEKYIPALSGYSGKDLLRMCKDDLIEICGHTADAIRLYNSVQNKVIIPRRTLYVSREQMNVFSAIYMSNYSSIDLLQKLSFFLGIQPDLVKDIHMVGPQSIRIQVENEVIMYMKDESMFHVSIAPETANTNCVIILLKPCNR